MESPLQIHRLFYFTTGFITLTRIAMDISCIFKQQPSQNIPPTYRGCVIYLCYLRFLIPFLIYPLLWWEGTENRFVPRSWFTKIITDTLPKVPSVCEASPEKTYQNAHRTLLDNTTVCPYLLGFLRHHSTI